MRAPFSFTFTIKFGGTGNLGGPFSQDITYHLRVVRRKKG